MATILPAEDETALGKRLARLLRAREYLALAVAGGLEALRLGAITQGLWIF